MKKIFLWMLLGATAITSAQKKKLTLEESVLQQNRQFRADMMAGFQWIPDTDRYVYTTDGGRKLMSASAKDRVASEWLTLDDVNKALGEKANSFNGIIFRDASTFVIPAGGDLYAYSVSTKTGSRLLDLNDEMESTTPSPDYTKVAYTQKNNLFYADAAGKSTAITNEKEGIVSGQTISRNEFGIEGGIFWSPKSTYLAFYQKDETGVADYPLLDINETPGKLVSIKYPMIGQTSEKVRVGIYHLASGKTVYISPRGAADDYMTNLSWTPDEKYVLIAELNRGQNDMRLNLYDAATGAFVRTLLQETSATWTEPEHPAFFPSTTSSNFVWISEKDGFNNLYYYGLDGKLIKQLTANRFVLRDILGSTKNGNTIFFSATGPNATNMLAYKVDLKGKQTLLTKDEGVHRVSFSTDGNWVFDEYSNHNTPSRSLLYDKNGKASVLLESKNKYEGYELGTADIRTIKSADGTTDLYTRLIKPSNFDPSKKYPVLVYVYGGPHAQLITNSWLDGANLWMYWMAEQGYLVFTVDGRGSDNRGKAFESVIHRRLGLNEMDDQLAGVSYLKSLPFVDGKRLAVHGWSYGGFMTTSLMLRKPGTFTTGVAGGPVTDWKYYEVMYGERYMDTPAENPEGFAENSTLAYVNNLQGKLLLIHGTSDDVVVMQQNFALLKKFIEAGKQVDFFAYPMHKHNVVGKDRVHLMDKVLHYIIDNNP
ncbi:MULTISPECIES: DPP IV N-terminal domain-containing protein [unclassified Flavobacterium]|uniref:S9 family peptidase n=1 Tax=unclassified Flavobacterium TaxID=196869 RepID=UPI001F13B4DC|nr:MULTISPECIES: DPP IV N-terminal domain-containing protein [unclassified Flavobacterium]UMY65501.1 S9 family peptidase [Flavobacterium sp. HJ-32-4]